MCLKKPFWKSCRTLFWNIDWIPIPPNRLLKWLPKLLPNWEAVSELDWIATQVLHTPMGLLKCLGKDMKLDEGKTRAFFDSHHIDATTDLPTPVFYRHLSDMYPNAKFILTTRSLASWEISAKRQMGGTVSGLLETQRRLAYGAGKYKEPEYPNAFLNHNKQVQAFFTDERLLVLNIIKEPSWGPICNFLNVSIPHEHFPHKLP